MDGSWKGKGGDSWNGKGKGGDSWNGKGKGGDAWNGKGGDAWNGKGGAEWWGWGGGGDYGPAKGKGWGPPADAWGSPYACGMMKGKGKDKGSGKAKGQPRYDADTEAQLDEWVDAKRSKDFKTADAIRDELRARGIDPDSVRPPGSGQSTAPSWQQQGPDWGDSWGWGGPWSWGPPDPWAWDSWGGGWGGMDAWGKGKGGGGAMSAPPIQKYDAETEALLDRWVQAKRGKDFAQADSIRADLRARDIDPDVARPPGSTDARALSRTTAAKFPNEQKVHISGFPEGVNVDQMKAIFNQANSHPKFISVGNSGKGLACFETPDEAAEAIGLLNGADLGDGVFLTVVRWKRSGPTP